MKNVVSRPVGTKERLRAARAISEGREHHRPVRKVIVKSTVRILRELYSVKMRCKIPCESHIEYDYFAVLDVRRDVKGFYAQPEVLHYCDHEGLARRHIPDAQVVFTSGKREFHEVKPDEVAAKPGIRCLHEAIAAEYARRGYDYYVIRESDIRRQPRLENAHLLRSTRLRRPDRADRLLVERTLASGPHTLQELENMLGRGAESRMDLLALVLNGVLEMDWERLCIDASTPVRLPETGR